MEAFRNLKMQIDFKETRSKGMLKRVNSRLKYLIIEELKNYSK